MEDKDLALLALRVERAEERLAQPVVSVDAYAAMEARVSRLEKAQFWMVTTVVSFGLTVVAGITIAVVSNALKN